MWNTEAEYQFYYHSYREGIDLVIDLQGIGASAYAEQSRYN